MTTITLDVSDDLAERLSQVGDRLPDLLSFALDVAGMPGNATAPLAQPSPAWLEAVDFLTRQPTPQEIIDFKLSSAVQVRLEELLELYRAGTLPPQARTELDTLRLINHLFVVLKARARASLAGA